MITALFELVQLPQELKELNKIRSKERFDCISYADKLESGYQGLTNFINKKGQMFFYKTPCQTYINADSRRMAEWSFVGNQLNLSSLYFGDIEFPEFAYGYPNANRLLSNKSQNPLFPFRNDAYLFLINKEFSKVEMLIIQDGRNLIGSYFQSLLDGDLDEEINELRKASKPFFQYIGL